MGKAILELDEMPNECTECRFHYLGMCVGCTRWPDVPNDGRPGWCPLKEAQ